MRPPLSPVEKQRRVVVRLLEKKRLVMAAPAPKRTTAPGRPPHPKSAVVATLTKKIDTELAVLNALERDAKLKVTQLADIKLVRKNTDAPRPGRPVAPLSVKLRKQLDTLMEKVSVIKALPDAAFAIIHHGGGRPMLSRQDRLADLALQIDQLKRQFRVAKQEEDAEIRQRLEEARKAAEELADANRLKQELDQRIAQLKEKVGKQPRVASRASK